MAEKENAEDHIPTGIEGLDALLYGGIPAGNQVVVSGGPGCGKTLMCFEIIYHMAKRGIPCAFIAFEEQENVVVNNFKKAFPSFSDVDALMEKNLLVVDGADVSSKMHSSTESEAYSFGSVISSIEEVVRANNAKCIVIDSLSLVKLVFSKPNLYRRYMLALALSLKKLGVTSLLTLELEHTNRKEASFGPEAFVFDGTLVMYQDLEEDKRIFSIEVVKMRGSNHSLSFAPYEITNKGFRVFTISEA